MPSLSVADLPPDLKKKVRAATGRARLSSRARTFTIEHERRWALRVLALVSGLTQDQRRRVLARAAKANTV